MLGWDEQGAKHRSLVSGGAPTERSGRLWGSARRGHGALALGQRKQAVEALGSEKQGQQVKTGRGMGNENRSVGAQLAGRGWGCDAAKVQGSGGKRERGRGEKGRGWWVGVKVVGRSEGWE